VARPDGALKGEASRSARKTNRRDLISTATKWRDCFHYEFRTKNFDRDVEASVVPIGTKVTLQKGETAHITQSLGGTYTVIVNGNMFRIESKDADALGIEISSCARRFRHGHAERPAHAGAAGEKSLGIAQDVLRPGIPVNIVDLGLIYDCHLTPIGENNYKADVKMTLTAPGCGMGPVLAQDVQNKLISLEPIDEANVELVWDPPWNQGMMTEAAKLQLGLL
jgi:probable FeS assembly SUF system protein SufT